MKRVILALLIFFPFITISCSKRNEISSHFIISVHDGDTFYDAEKTKYRLYAVDTAEISDQYHDFKSTLGLEQIYAYEAMEFVRDRIFHKHVDVIKMGTDRYGRCIARIIINGEDLSILLIRAGLARVAYIDINEKSIYYTSDFEYYKKILISQKEAHDKQEGFWKHEDKFNLIFPKA